MKLVSDPEVIKQFEESYAKCEIRYGDLKKQLAEDIIAVTNPIRTRINEYLADDDYLGRVTKIGAEKGRESASKTLEEVKKIIGFKRFF